MGKLYLLLLIYLLSLSLLFAYMRMMLTYKKNKTYFSFSTKARCKNNLLSRLVVATNFIFEKIGTFMISIFKIKNLKKYSEFIEYFNFKNSHRLNESMVIGYKYIMAISIMIASIVFFKGNILGLLFSLPMGLLGFFIPDILIKRTESAKIRKIEKEIPYIIDLLYISALSGQNIYRSIEILTQNHRSILCFEFERFLKDVDMGSGKKNAYENMLKSNRSKEFQSLVILLMQTEKHGCQLSDLLKQKSKFIKFKNADLMNQKIKTSNLKMLFPIIFLILPAFILLVCGPIFYLIGGNIFFSK